MSFMIVPPVSYQTKKKLQAQEEKKKAHKKKKSLWLGLGLGLLAALIAPSTFLAESHDLIRSDRSSRSDATVPQLVGSMLLAASHERGRANLMALDVRSEVRLMLSGVDESSDVGSTSLRKKLKLRLKKIFSRKSDDFLASLATLADEASSRKSSDSRRDSAPEPPRLVEPPKLVEPEPGTRRASHEGEVLGQKVYEARSQGPAPTVPVLTTTPADRSPTPPMPLLDKKLLSDPGRLTPKPEPYLTPKVDHHHPEAKPESSRENKPTTPARSPSPSLPNSPPRTLHPIATPKLRPRPRIQLAQLAAVLGLLNMARQNLAILPRNVEKFDFAQPRAVSPLLGGSALSTPLGGATLVTYNIPNQRPPAADSPETVLASHESYYAERQPLGHERAGPKVAAADRDSIGYRYLKEHIANNPEFLPVTDLCVFNDIHVLLKHMITPTYQFLRYQLFLDIMSDHHRHDPITFALIRLNLIDKFTARHRSNLKHPMDDAHGDVRHYEGALALLLLNVRLVLRDNILEGITTGENLGRYYPLTYSPNRQVLKPLGIKAPRFVSLEELNQINLINHVRYIINLTGLPELLPHHQFKQKQLQIADALYRLLRAELGNDVLREFLMVLTIAKVLYDYVLLEKYHLQILTKFLANSVTDDAILKKLWTKRALTQTVPLVLIYNCTYLVQLGWYFAHMVPFCRIYELLVVNETKELTIDPGDELVVLPMEHDYFNRLRLGLYYLYRQKLAKELLERVRAAAPPKLHKPINFHYFPGKLAEIPAATFDLIQSRDLMYQLTPQNYVEVLDQFHRILVADGVVEFPCILFNNNRLLDINIAEVLGLLPDFFNTVMAQLKKKFTVKYLVAVLDPLNQVCRFLINHAGMQFFDMVDKLDDYCQAFTEDGCDPRIANTVHYYVHIRGEKA